MPLFATKFYGLFIYLYLFLLLVTLGGGFKIEALVHHKV